MATVGCGQSLEVARVNCDSILPTFLARLRIVLMKMKPTLAWRCVLAVGVIMIFAPLLGARPGVVRTLDGHKIEGDITENEDAVTVSQRGIQTVVQRSNVASIEYTLSVQDEFNQRLKKLGKNDAQGRVDLARWAFERREYRLARQAIREALEIDPNSRAATDLDELVSAQQMLEANSRHAGPPSTAATRAVDAKVAQERRLLTPDEINRIRQCELKSTDVHTRIRLENNVARRFATDMNIPVSQFLARPLAAQAVEIVAEGNGRYNDDVRILSDPSSLLEYRRAIQPHILTNCSTVGCHGSPDKSKLVLFPTVDVGDASTYTNFYILQHYRRIREGVQPSSSPFSPDVTAFRLIDRQRPEDSLLAQFSLPPEFAQFRHPAVANYRPWLKSQNDPHYKELIAWMGTSLVPNDPQYGINYPIPGDVSATEPVTAPANAPAKQPNNPARTP